MKLGVALGWHAFAWEDLLALVQRAESLGYAAAYVDGDVSQLGVRREVDVLDGWTVTAALIAHTQRIQIGSLRVVHHWNAAHLAQAAATLERIAPGRLRFFASIGDRPEDPRFGYPRLSAAERIAWLDETLDAVRALWRGESVTRSGRYVRLDAARVRPTPPGGSLPIEIAAKGPRLLGLVARHADVWNVNLPPIPARFAEAEAQLREACADAGRDPDAIARCMWIFTRIEAAPDPDRILAEFRRLNPWFAGLGDGEAREALVVGDAEHCAARLRALARQFGLDLPVVDLSGMELGPALQTLEALPSGVDLR
ncbi:MAG: LLM class flavin-dependent oxidoreductase [Myxococcales bacterium]|nr:LLM class flavin-dependent oxidoreductase [Myxococcales bacterium]MDH5306387.1 LLM class flavin-dependent oxidoreductase [Myxococcales bacterium]MDH5566343.1 LLM class flavin-dependent oxidoreductase [Myxococcales bacterium]